MGGTALRPVILHRDQNINIATQALASPKRAHCFNEQTVLWKHWIDCFLNHICDFLYFRPRYLLTEIFIVFQTNELQRSQRYRLASCLLFSDFGNSVEPLAMQLKGFSAANTPDLLEVLQLFHYLITVRIYYLLELTALQKLFDLSHCIRTNARYLRELLSIRDLLPVSANTSDGSPVPEHLAFIPLNLVLFHHFFEKFNYLLVDSTASFLFLWLNHIILANTLRFTAFFIYFFEIFADFWRLFGHDFVYKILV